MKNFQNNTKAIFTGEKKSPFVQNFLEIFHLALKFVYL